MANVGAAGGACGIRTKHLREVGAPEFCSNSDGNKSKIVKKSLMGSTGWEEMCNHYRLRNYYK
jgi:hypothetical protein